MRLAAVNWTVVGVILVPIGAVVGAWLGWKATKFLNSGKITNSPAETVFDGMQNLLTQYVLANDNLRKEMLVFQEAQDRSEARLESLWRAAHVCKENLDNAYMEIEKMRAMAKASKVVDSVPAKRVRKAR